MEKTKTNYNHNHPEIEKGESFWLNCKTEAKVHFLKYANEKYPSWEIRFGVSAYTPRGKKVLDHVPVFRK